ncbi:MULTISPECIES: dienelactone hydrolase family protein [Alteromonadaceae]|uniref:Dienelactone hydrolase family protein n=1 Tax=Brumicola blandensis TaxID=3075611 RepID=A0AAW8QYF7_9ALTE|nr:MULTISPECIES: dienelactone hydrolase family protein [unclassified Alteromonas]MDT0581987.1 dienelactone hydrolase family protein [Alteromonas sp. W409]MDT0628086.1 dienelactone hydrolase family protein [Alteromonas sp. W364]
MTSHKTDSLKPEDIPQQAFDWYDEYAHGDINRRTFLSRLGTLSVAGLSLGLISSSLIPDYAKAEQVSFNDADIKATYETFDSPLGHGKGEGYLVVPRNLDKKAPTVLVVHENRGLNPYIKDVARRLAKAGFVAFAPDALAPLGGYPGNDDEGRSMQRSLDRDKIEQDFMAAANWLKKHESGTGKLGVVGFCFGGYISNLLAATMPNEIDAAVPYYGTPAKAELQQNVKGPLMIHFAELDKRVNASWESYEAVLKANDANYKAHFYAGAQHGFHNDSTSRFSPQDADLSWQRTLDFFGKHLA